MSRLKHIIILVIMLSAFGLAVNAQSSVLRPYEGATHTYSWNGLAAGLDYQFYLTANADGTGLLDDIATGEFDFLNSATGTIGVGESSASVQIGWHTGAATHIYFVWLQVTNAGGCSNKRYIEVTPQVNDFNLLSENLPVTNTVSCPATAPADGFNASSVAYSAGYTNLQFNVIRENGTNNPLTASVGDTYNWSFVPTLGVDPDLSLGKVIISISGANSGVIAPVAGRYTVNGLDNNVTVTVSIENAPGYTRDITLEATQVRENSTNLPDNDPSDNAAVHTIQVMPVINGMGGV